MKLIETYGEKDARTLLLQMVDDHDLEGMDREVSLIKELTGGQDFCLKIIKVDSWNRDLSPWPAPAVFGKEDFGEGASETLAFLLREIIPGFSAREDGKPENENLRHADGTDRKIILGGYSLAGLFALWAGYQTDCFSCIAAASPSIWFPGFTDYMRSHSMKAGSVYLSLGDREERTRNPLMSQVGKAIRTGQEILQEAGINCTLEWNQGNHFKEPDVRTAKAFAWGMSQRDVHRDSFEAAAGQQS